MQTLDQQAAVLRGFIERADRAEIAQVQNALLAYALEREGPAARAGSLDDLLRRLGDDIRPDAMNPLQQAFYVVVLSMIERTRNAVGSPSRPSE